MSASQLPIPFTISPFPFRMRFQHPVRRSWNEWSWGSSCQQIEDSLAGVVASDGYVAVNVLRHEPAQAAAAQSCHYRGHVQNAFACGHGIDTIFRFDFLERLPRRPRRPEKRDVASKIVRALPARWRLIDD